MAVKKSELKEIKKDKLLFTKEQILQSKKYEGNRDLISVLLVDSDFYSLEEVDKKLGQFMKGKVN